MKILTFIGKVLIGTALLILILGVMVFAVGGFLITRPILRNNPAMRKMHAMSYAMVSIFALVSAFTPDIDESEETPKPPTVDRVNSAYNRRMCVHCDKSVSDADYERDVCANCGMSPLGNRPVP